jgi:hypothetical protein
VPAVSELPPVATVPAVVKLPPVAKVPAPLVVSPGNPVLPQPAVAMVEASTIAFASPISPFRMRSPAFCLSVRLPITEIDSLEMISRRFGQLIVVCESKCG